MKKRNITLWALMLLGSLLGSQLSAQTNVNMPYNTGSVTTFSLVNPQNCTFFNFFDNGGSAGLYSNSSNPALSAVTFAPANAGNKMRAQFTTFSTEASFDALYIYDGTVASVPNILNVGINTVIPGQFNSGQAQNFTFRAGGWQGTGSPGTIQASAGNATGALTFQFDSDLSGTSTGWVATIVELASGACAMTASPASQTISTGANDCSATATVNSPVFSPAGCNASLTLRYTVNGGTPIIVPQPVPATITIPNLPKGTNIIQWQLVDLCFGAVASSATQTVNVVDLVPPTINCPANMTFNLAPGACEQIVSFNVTATDNCPLVVNQAAWAVDTAAPLLVNNSLSCGPGAIINNYFQVLTQPAGAFNSGFNTTFARIGVNSAYTVGSTFTVRLYRLNNPAQPFNVTLANRTLLGASQPVALPGGIGGGNINVPISVNVPAGATVLMEIQASAPYSVGNQAGNGQSTWIGSLPCGLSPDNPSTFASLGFGGQDVAAVLYGQVAAPPPSQTAGLPSGSSFPIGTTTNCFLAVDVAGNTSTCCFNVTVLEYPNPIQSLVCNDLVQVSLDENCTAIIGADQVLEGGPYGCYDDYIVELDKTAPFGNGPWVPAVLGPGDVGKTYQVRVTDPDTGNKCWGNLKVEDKLPPVLDCQPYSLPCNADATPGAVSTTIGPKKQLNTITSGGNGNSSGGMVWFNINNISGAPVTITGFGANISGATNINVYTKSGTHVGFETNPGAWTLAGVANANTGPFSGPFPGNGTITAAPLATPITIPPGITGVALHTLTASSNYTNGNGSNQTFSDGTLTLNLGSTANTPWGAPFTPRVFNGYVEYQTIIEAKSFPNDLELNVNVFPTGTPGCYTVSQGAGTPVLEPCSDASLCYIDTEVQQDCASGLTKIINRKWTARDASGNTATCIQQISFLRPTLGAVQLPPNYDDVDEPALECNSGYPTPQYLEGIGLQGFPYVFDKPDGCSINWTYTDIVIKVCDGTYKILRKWAVIDWCAGEDVEHNQIIKVLDDAGPSMDCPANLTVGTDPFQCCATVNLPDIIIEDNCSRIKSISAMVIGFDPQTNEQIGMFNVGGSLQNFPGNNLWDLDTLGAFGTTPCLPLGTHTVIYMAEDDCGNTSTCSFRVTVRDYTPPVAACDEFTVVGIGVDDPFDCYVPSDACNFAGVTWVKATTFDDGSYDNCGDLYFTVQRMSPYSDCINNLNPINGHPECDPAIDPFPDFPSEFERAISEGDSIKFYCCEVGTTQTVILRVYQLDANGNITVGPDGSPVRNECMVQVEVQDKIKPVCQAPANVSVSCENFDPSLWAYGNASVYDNCCLDTSLVYQGQCGLTHTVNLSLFDTVCNKGTITRTFRATDCYGQSSTCTQRVFVRYEQDYYVRFPNDVIVTVCDGTGNYGEPTFFGEDCELLGVSFEDEVFTVVPDACYNIERTWTIINWCTYDPNQGCTIVPNPNPNPAVNHPSNLPGPTVSACGTPAPWAPTTVAIAPGQTPTNYCTFWSANANCYKYKQIIKVIDTQDPVVTCPASPVEVCDLTPNDPLLWNKMYWYDATINSHDLCEAPTDLCITATDLCSGSNINIRYLLFLDLDGDGTMESVVNSVNTGIAGLGWNAVPYGNASNPNYAGGEIRQFDDRPVLPNQKYGFAIQTTTSGVNKTACVRWNTQQSQNTYVVPELPYGTHKIKWFIEDGCGNETICEYTFVVKDCKKPTVVCLNGLSVNIMPTKMISLWDTDFLQYTEDNCTPSGQLVTAIRRSGTGTGFPLNPDGTPQKVVSFTCDDLGTQLVELWSRDKAGNADYCETYVIIQDNMGICNGQSATVAGTLKTEAQNGLEDAKVDLSGSHPALPPVNMFAMSNNAGDYTLAGVPFLGNYTLTPQKDNDPLNGVSTFDLVLINKHILGLEPLSTPYKMIAADANNSRSITTFDIVELRKLILGIYTELPNNTSWRFVDKSYVFPNPSNPFLQIFPETKQLADLQADKMNEHFTSVKVGDVNGNAVSNTLMSAEDRTAGTMLFDVEERAVKAGETFTVNFKAAEKVQGYQFTMNYNNLEVLDIVPGANMKVDNFAVFAQEGALTTSWDGDAQAEFAITFRAKAAGNLSQMLGVSSRITKAEAYNADSDRLQVAFRFNSPNGSTISGLGFELYQNTPNPFVNRTQIGFYLPEAAEATLTIFDESGRMIFTQTGDFGKGYNAVTIDRSVLNTTGLLYYKLETATDSATRKMIQSK